MAAPALTVSRVGSAAMSLKGGAEASNQGGCGEWLGQEANCSGLQRSGAEALIGEGRDENERHTITPGAHSVSSSTPLITDICTSAITHDVSSKWADRKNSSADAMCGPCVSMRPQKIVSRGADGLDMPASIHQRRVTWLT
jgi:hypothetical protein